MELTSNEIIKKLFISFSNKDSESFYQLAEEYIRLEERKNHNSVVKDLKKALYNKDTNMINGKRFKPELPIPRDNESGFPLLEVKKFDIPFDALILNENIKNILNQIIKETRNYEILATYNLQYKNKLLFCGLPGTGKTYSAKVLSSVLQIPLIYIKFDAIISSYLGETATNLRKVFEYIKNGMWVVLFDEVDIIGKNRDDHYEHGEIKRVVNNFLQMLDEFEGESLLICATNHQHILDPAIWRRFDEVIKFELPDILERENLLIYYLKPIQKKNIDFNYFATKTEKFSPSDIRKMCLEGMRYSITNHNNIMTSDDLEYALSRFKERIEIRENHNHLS